MLKTRLWGERFVGIGSATNIVSMRDMISRSSQKLLEGQIPEIWRTEVLADRIRTIGGGPGPSARSSGADRFPGGRSPPSLGLACLGRSSEPPPAQAGRAKAILSLFGNAPVSFSIPTCLTLSAPSFSF